MYEWNEMVQLMIDWIDNDITTTPSLMTMSKQLGYSPYYCTKQFHSLTGMTLRDYVWMRRISRAALELRDTEVRILDIAVKYGFSSQEAFTRAFVKAFQVTPSAYRKSPGPIPLAIRAEVFSPYHYVIKERGRMREVQVQEAEIKVEFIPAHKFIGIWDSSAQHYGQFWGNGEVMSRVEQAAWSFDPASMGYEWDEDTKQDYQRHFPEGYGYAVLRPVKKLG